MAAASGEANLQSYKNEEAGRVLAEDSREGKKRKFRPFEAVRKFFKSGKKGAKSKEDVRSVSVKSRSLQMIPGQEDSDDDGGFKKRLGSRSISEDSVFQPDVKESKMEAIRQTAISMEGLNKDFQSELASKLKKRYSAYSSDDEALPQSPSPLITTADIVMGGSLKPLPGTGKSRSRESDISIDASETEEDDLFKTDWSKSVASVSQRKSSDQSLPESADMDLDLSAIGSQTITLSNDAARHRISVKRNIVKRRPSGTRKNKDHRASATSPLPQVKEESPAKSDNQKSPVAPEPPSPVMAVSPKPLSPKSSSQKTDLITKTEDKLPEQKTTNVFDYNKNTTDILKKTEVSVITDVSKKPEEHKTVISVGQNNEKEVTIQHASSSGPRVKSQEETTPIKSKSLDRRMNYNLSDHAKPTDNIRQIARNRPKSLHDSALPSHGSDKNVDSELKTYNKMKRNSLKDAESAISGDVSKDTGFYVVGSLKNKEKDIPFGARRPETKPQITSFNDGISAKPTEVLPTTTQANNVSTKTDLVKPAVSQTKPNITGYVLKKEPLKSQSSLSGDKKDSSPTKPNVAIETKSDTVDSQRETVKQTLSDSGKEIAKDLVNVKGAENKNAKEPKSNYDNVILKFESGSKKTNNETKDVGKIPDKVVIISAEDRKKDESPIKGRNSDNIVITTNESTNKLASPREEYRLKRQSRSRTLPEQPVSVDLFSNKPTTKKDSLTQSFRIKEDGLKTDVILEKSETKPLESKTKTLSGTLNTSSTEVSQPAWRKMAKKIHEDGKDKETDSLKDKGTSKPAFTGARVSSLSDSTKDKFTPKSVFTSGSTSDISKEKDKPKLSESSSFRTTTKSGFIKSTNPVSSSEPQKDAKVTKPNFSGVGSLNNKDNKDTKNSDKKTEEKSQISAASLAKSFESSLKSTSTGTGHNVSLDTPRGWKSNSSIKKNEVKIEIIEKTDTTKPEETSKTSRTTTAKKLEEKAPLLDKTVPEKCVDKKSKVLDMVKNFQNLQVS